MKKFLQTKLNINVQDFAYYFGKKLTLSPGLELLSSTGAHNMNLHPSEASKAMSYNRSKNVSQQRPHVSNQIWSLVPCAGRSFHTR